VELAVARDLDLEHIRKSIDDRDADTMQTAGRLVGVAVELAAGMQLGHDDLERRFSRYLRVVLDRYTATIVGNAEKAFRIEMDLDEIGVTGDSLIHRIVDHFGEQV